MQLMKWTLRGLAVLTGLSALTALAAVFTGDKLSPSMLLLAALQGAIAYGFWRWSSRGGEKSGGRPGDLAALVSQAEAYMNQVNADGQFGEVQTKRALSTPDRPIIFATGGTLLELKATRSSQHIGTRLNVGGIPLFIGKSIPVTKTDLSDASEGELVLYPDRLLFSGTLRSTDFQLSRVAGIEVFSDAFTITVTGRARPVMFKVANPVLWSQIVKNALHLKLQGRVLPEGARLQAL